jgi:hypothetical protein
MSGRGSMKEVAGTEPRGGACDARTRDGGRCRKPSGWGTDHPGQGRCRLHGGATPVKHGRFSTIRREEIRTLAEHHAANPDPLNILGELAIVRALLDDYINRYDEWREALLAWHESYRAVERPLAHDRLQAMETVADELEALVGPADLDEEDQEEDGARVRKAIKEARALIEDLQKPGDESKPRKILDLADAVGHAEAVSRIVKRIEDIRAQNAISRPEFFRVMGEMGRVVETYNAEPDPVRRLERIREGWLSIRLA